MCGSNLSATASEWNVHSFGIQPEPSRPVGTAAEVVERVVRFVARSTTDWCQKDAERSRSGVHKCYLGQKRQVAEAEAASDVLTEQDDALDAPVQ